ncbi:hypothetical protein CHH83_26125 [Bacillus sp. 7586-K]|nr:hypothetical protein CHH83_26125 [Bacillus sp. 7586-K]
MNEDTYQIIKHLIQKTKGKKTIVEINNLETNNNGFNNNISMFHLNYFQGRDKFSRPVVLKRYKGNDNFNKELNILRSKPINRYINIPNVYFEDKETNILLMDQVKGITLDEYFLSNHDDISIAFSQFGKTLARIHAIDINTLNDNLTDNLLQEDYFGSYIKILRNRVKSFGDSVYMSVLENIVYAFKTVEFNEVLNHGDYHFLNTIITEENKLYILDWEKAFIGDYRYDIANTLVIGYSWFGTNFKEPMLEAYQNIANKKIEHLECFEALLSFDSFTKIVPIIQGADDSHIRSRSCL